MDVHGTKLARTLFTIATGVNAVPPNKGMELTVKSDTPFAKRRAKGAPLLPAAHPRRWAASLMKQIRIRSYFSLPTDLAAEMRDWPEFVAGESYSVDLRDNATGETVSVRFIEAGEDCYVTVEAATSGKLFERVVGRVVCALSAHSDNLMVSDHG